MPMLNDHKPGLLDNKPGFLANETSKWGHIGLMYLRLSYIHVSKLNVR